MKTDRAVTPFVEPGDSWKYVSYICSVKGESRDEVTALGNCEAEQTTSQDETLDQYPIYLEFFS
jgi:hypothetical protein